MLLHTSMLLVPVKGIQVARHRPDEYLCCCDTVDGCLRRLVLILVYLELHKDVDTVISWLPWRMSARYVPDCVRIPQVLTRMAHSQGCMLPHHLFFPNTHSQQHPPISHSISQLLSHTIKAACPIIGSPPSTLSPFV